MERCCTLCDADCEDGEMLCAACLADPDQRDAYQAIVGIARTRNALVAHYGAARQALRRARGYRREGDGNTQRVRACLDEVSRCRHAIRVVRRGRAAPGLAKARPSSRPEVFTTRRVS